MEGKRLWAFAVAILRAMKDARYHHTLFGSIDLIDQNIGQARDDPFEGTGLSSGVPHQWKRNQQLGAFEEPLGHILCVSRAVLSDPAIDVFEIDDGVIIENKLHRTLRA